jgi:hypothetical protein
MVWKVDLKNQKPGVQDFFTYYPSDQRMGILMPIFWIKFFFYIPSPFEARVVD